MILSDNEIRSELAQKGHIVPFSPRVDKPAVTYSYGLGPAGYDGRLFGEFMFTDGSVEFHSDYFDLKPFQNILCSTLEWFHIPPTLVGEVWGKSSLARQFVLVNATPLEPGWSGQITLEISNLGPKTVRLFVGQGICQVRYQRLTSEAGSPYAGRYQDQVGVTPFLDPEPVLDASSLCAGIGMERGLYV